MEANLSIPSYLHSQIPVRVNYRYLMNLGLFDFTLSNEENSALLLIDHEVVLLGQFLKYGECSFKLFLRLKEDKIIRVASVPDLRISYSFLPFSKKVFKINVEESRTEWGSLVDPLLDSDEFVASLEIGVFIQPLEEEEFLVVIDIQVPENSE